jgi:hypothetical protein
MAGRDYPGPRPETIGAVPATLGAIPTGKGAGMAAKESFDVSTGVDLQEVDNAVNQAQKELSTRYDFKNVKFQIEFDRKGNALQLSAPDHTKLDAIWDTLQSKMVRRGVPLRNLHRGKVDDATGGTLRLRVDLVQGLSTEIAREVVKTLKEAKLKRVQAAIQEDQVRVTGPSRDDLQEAIRLLKAGDFGVELKFGNFRSG